jgi:hypothetical protein
MQNKKDIRSRNDKGQAHGYWEVYWNDGTLYYKCFYVNNIEYGYSQLYETNEVYDIKEYYAR